MHGKYKNACNILVGEVKVIDHLEDQGVNERTILEWILEKYGVRLWTRYIWLKTGTSGGLL
jgi:hypothetical protein